MDFSFVTYSELPNLDPDDQILIAGLKELGYECEAVIWDDPSVNWAEKTICVVRSTWNYHLHQREFAHWVQETGAKTCLLNAPNLLLWNMNKNYLQELAAAGVPIVPSAFVSAHSKAHLSSLMRINNWSTGIIKPVVGLATHAVKKFSTASIDDAQSHLDDLLTKGDAIVQSFIPSVETYGERALIFVDGEFGHAVRKQPFQSLAAAGHAGEEPAEASSAELEVAGRAMACLPSTPLYARVDLVAGQDGEPLLLEFELIEPSLFLAFNHETAALLVTALSRRRAAEHYRATER